MLYRDFANQEQIDAQYDIRRSVEDPAPFRAHISSRAQSLVETARLCSDSPHGIRILLLQMQIASADAVPEPSTDQLLGVVGRDDVIR